MKCAKCHAVDVTTEGAWCVPCVRVSSNASPEPWGTCKLHPGAEPGCGECLRDLRGYVGRDGAPTIEVEDVARDGTGPWRLVVNGYGVATWPHDTEACSPRERAEEVAEVLRDALERGRPLSDPADEVRVRVVQASAMHWAAECDRLSAELARARATNDRHCAERDASLSASQEWEHLCMELRERESRMSGILCDLADVPSDPLEGLRVLAEHYRAARCASPGLTFTDEAEAELVASLPRTSDCATCEGSGNVDGGVCGSCGGKGLATSDAWPRHPDGRPVICSECRRAPGPGGPHTSTCSLATGDDQPTEYCHERFTGGGRFHGYACCGRADHDGTHFVTEGGAAVFWFEQRSEAARPCAHDWRTIESDNQAGERLVKCRKCGTEQVHKLVSEAARPKTGPELAAEYGFKPHGLRPDVAAGLGSAEAPAGCPECPHCDAVEAGAGRECDCGTSVWHPLCPRHGRLARERDQPCTPPSSSSAPPSGSSSAPSSFPGSTGAAGPNARPVHGCTHEPPCSTAKQCAHMPEAGPSSSKADEVNEYNRAFHDRVRRETVEECARVARHVIDAGADQPALANVVHKEIMLLATQVSRKDGEP